MDLILILLRAPTMKIYASPWVEYNLSYKCNVNSCWTYLNVLLQVASSVLNEFQVSSKQKNNKLDSCKCESFHL